MPYARYFSHALALCGAIILSPAAASAQDASGLPGGASSLRETYDDWVVNCAVQAQGGGNIKLCTLSQEQTDSNSHQRVLAIEIKPEKENEGVSGTLMLPFGLALDQGATFQIDDSPAGPTQKFRTCIPAGCLVSVSFDAQMLAVLRKGAQLKVKAVVDGGKDTLFTISLKGFPNAFDRTAALAK
jgi:invasion protein IalB